MVLRRAVLLRDEKWFVDGAIFKGMKHAAKYLVLQKLAPLQEESEHRYEYLFTIGMREVEACLCGSRPRLGMHHDWLDVIVYSNGTVLAKMRKGKVNGLPQKRHLEEAI